MTLADISGLVSAVIAGVALIVSIAAIWLTRLFAQHQSEHDLRVTALYTQWQAEHDFIRDQSYRLCAEHYRTALALATGTTPTERPSDDRLVHLDRTAAQLRILGRQELADAFTAVAKVRAQWETGRPSPDAIATVTRLTELLRHEFRTGPRVTSSG